MGIVGEIHQQRDPAKADHVAAAGVFLRAAAKARKPPGHGLQGQLQGRRQGDRSQRIGQVMPGLAAQAGREIIHRQHRLPRPAFSKHKSTLIEKAGAAASTRPVRQPAAAGLQAEPGDLAGMVEPGGPELRVVGVQHQAPARLERPGNQKLRGGQVLHRLDPIVAEVVGRHIGDQAGIRSAKRQAPAHQPAARHLQDR